MLKTIQSILKPLKYVTSGCTMVEQESMGI